MKIMIAQVSPSIGDLRHNQSLIKENINAALLDNADVVVFPEMVTTGYPPKDLLYDHYIWISHEKLVKNIEEFILSTKKQITVIFGGIREVKEPYGMFSRYNTAFIIDPIYRTRFVHKKLLPCYDVFDENIYFKPGNENSTPIPISYRNKDNELKTSYCDVIICEDMWNFQNKGTVPWMSPGSYMRDPVSELKGDGPIFIINASPYWENKISRTTEILKDISNTLDRLVVWANQVGGYDDLVFGGYSMFVYGHKCKRALSFSTDKIFIDVQNFIPSETIDTCPFKNIEPEDVENYFLFKALGLGLKDYCARNGFKKIVFGCSGGIDSALVGAIASHYLGGENVTGITMPSDFSSEGSWKDSEDLARNFGFKLLNWNIKNIHHEARLTSLQGSDKIEFKNNVTNENIMPRIRAMLLMSYSNDEGALLVSTGNKSEIACGYFTLYGDSCGGYALLSDVYKTRVYDLARFINKYLDRKIPSNIINKEPSAELALNQKDIDSLPPYSLLDSILKYMIEKNLPKTAIYTIFPNDISSVQKVENLMLKSEHKRSQTPIGPKVTERAFGSGRDIPISKNLNYVM